jgi:hypothetical protein
MNICPYYSVGCAVAPAFALLEPLGLAEERIPDGCDARIMSQVSESLGAFNPHPAARDSTDIGITDIWSF